MHDPASLIAALAGRYDVERELGAGGMATVYLAEDVKHHRKVAVKVLKPELAATVGSERFAREIEVAARLQHPNILPLLDSGEVAGFFFYVMPYVEGESLRDRLARSGELPIPDAVRILMEVADALSEAHAHGVVHRDIKPDNVLLRGRHALVADFGVAKAVSEAARQSLLTSTGVALGTPTYMAPEQALADKHQDHRVDIYALGVLGYELLTGRAPFSATSAQEMLAAHVTAAPEPLERYRPAVPPALAAVVLKCLAKKPADRWQSAEEVVTRLEAFTTPSGGTTPVQTAPVTAVRRRTLVFGSVGLLAAAVVVYALLGGRGESGGSTAPNPMWRRIPMFGFESGAWPEGSYQWGGTPAITADGMMIAWNGRPEGAEPWGGRLFAQPLTAGARPLDISPDSQFQRLRRGVQGFSWLPDGRTLVLNTRDGSFAMPATGGTPRLLTSVRGLLSPTGEFVARPAGRRIMVVPVQGRDTIWLLPPREGEDSVSSPVRIIWSPDGSSIVAGSFDQNRRGLIYQHSVTTRTPRLLVADSVLVVPIAWNRVAGALYYTRQIGVRARQVWKLPLSPEGVPRAKPVLVIPSIDAKAAGMSISDSGSMLAAIAGSNVDNIRLVSTGNDTTTRWLTKGNGLRYFPRFSPDGRRVAFALDEGTTTSLWVARTDSGQATQFAFSDAGVIAVLAWSPDGDRIAVCRWGEAAPRLDVVTVATSVVERIPTHSLRRSCWIAWISSDEITYKSLDSACIVRSLKSAAERLLWPHDGGCWRAEVDPTGRYLALTFPRKGTGGQHVWLVSLKDSSERILLRNGYGGRWSTTGDAYYAHRFGDSLSGGGPVRITLAGGTTSLPKVQQCGLGGDGDISPDGSQYACNQVTEWRTELWLIEHFDPTWPTKKARPRR